MKRQILLEKHENYQKQSYRNRCYIYGANGCLTLVIPVLKQRDNDCGILDVTIDPNNKWQRIHWKSIESAYRLSPYFEYYADDLHVLFQKSFVSLFEWNLSVLQFILNALEIQPHLSFTETYQFLNNDACDYRQSIHPKKRLNKTDPAFKPIPYQQVFSDRFGFLSNLSVIDLIFNEGTHAPDVIRACIAK